MTKTRVAVAGLALVAAGLGALPLQAQDWTRGEFPLAPTNAANNIVAPYFDGWYQNDDGTYTLSFGFMNRNDDETIEIPLGSDNYIEPAQYDGVQPTSFPVVGYGGFGGPRERGVFGIVVPADFRGDIWWHLATGNYRTKVPGRLVSPGTVIQGAYELSTGGQAQGSMRPGVRFSENGPSTWGQVGVFHPRTFETRVGVPVEIAIWADDRAVGRDLRDVNMTLWKHQGPVGGEVTFMSLVPQQPASGRGGGGAGTQAAGPAPEAGVAEPPSPPTPSPVEIGQSIRLSREGPMANEGRFTAAFGVPGEYVVRVRIDNFTVGDSSMGNACCWSNGYVRVSVTE